MATNVKSEITGNIWKIEVADGASVNVGDVIIIMESMKMEINVEAPVAGVCKILVTEGTSVQEGDVLASIE